MSIFYLIFIALAAYFSFRYDRIEEHDSHKNHRLWLMWGYMTLLTGFSYGLGADKFTYMREFEKYPDSFNETGNFIWYSLMMRGQMPLWTLVNMVAKTVFNSFYVVQLLESAAINFTVCYLLTRYTHRYFLFMLVYFFTLQYFVFNTEVMREGFAMSFALLGMEGYISGKKWLYFVMLPIGVMFHVSALITLLFPLVNFKVNRKSFCYALAVSFAFWFLSDLLLGKVMIAALGGVGAMVSRLLVYSSQATNLFGYIRYALTFLVFPFIIMYYALQHEQSEERRRRKERMTAFAMTLGIVASAMVGFVRFYNYVEIFYLIMFAEFIYLLAKEKRHFIIRVGTLAGTVLFIALTYLNHYDTTNTYFYHFFYPYTCILSEDDDVYVREIAHSEALELEVKDDNTRSVD